MRRLLVFSIVGFVLSGCAAKVISSSPQTVVVRAPDTGYAEAQALADKECGKNQRYVRMIKQPTPFATEFVFDCTQ
ncbi:hypothetical protein C8R32_12326 [Nitrosospira sp. Nsp5]|uniref:Lipoprotein n=1 Tax=Nitrosospira multiformis TaxID=1231 RepID=A0ABY0TDF2_9PROT|nr:MULTISPECIES: hypothetical protein [Nitrosospira]PTR05362.1 hypothetical protein C8R32_12326 [Nitrosospira sp. Nsp5]SDQ66326.1 hypothetical protein SAMN05216402_1753 [Nitrosospira multiformis]